MKILLKKDVKFEWDSEGNESFRNIKYFIARSLVLTSPDYSKEFQIFSFASEDTIVEVLLHKNKKGQEQPIAFMSRSLHNSELKYTIMEKQVYALVKSLKHFRTYVEYSKVVGYVPHSVVKDIVSQHDFLDIRGNWV